jgi:hypothetical protein
MVSPCDSSYSGGTGSSFPQVKRTGQEDTRLYLVSLLRIIGNVRLLHNMPSYGVRGHGT